MHCNSKLPVIAVITTGGTISSSFNHVSKSINFSLSGKDLISSIPEVNEIANIKLIERPAISSPNFTVKLILKLAKFIRETLRNEDVDGVVVVQGTDTMEETSYLTNLICRTSHPVIFTGAMKSQHEPYADSRGNLLAAIRTACTPGARDQGTLVVMNQEIHSAREVIKVNSELISAFQSPGLGPLGYVYSDGVVIYRNAPLEPPLQVNCLQENVELIKCYLDMSDLLFKACLENNVKGLVIEGFGLGNIPESLFPVVKDIVKKGIPVVLCSRCLEGRVLDLYAYPGGGRRLKEIGLIFAGRLSGPKARLKLMTALGAGIKGKKLQAYFEQEYLWRHKS